jgi:hypothetical protein
MINVCVLAKLFTQQMKMPEISGDSLPVRHCCQEFSWQQCLSRVGDKRVEGACNQINALCFIIGSFSVFFHKQPVISTEKKSS